MTEPVSAGNPLGRVLGGVLIACGFLILTLSGLCSVVVATLFVQGGDFGGLWLVVPFGGVPLLLGLGLALLGRTFWRRSKPPPPRVEAF